LEGPEAELAAANRVNLLRKWELLVGGDEKEARAAFLGRPRGYTDAVLKAYGDGPLRRFLQHGWPVNGREVSGAEVFVSRGAVCLSGGYRADATLLARLAHVLIDAGAPVQVRKELRIPRPPV
jgi:hypothetical protein